MTDSPGDRAPAVLVRVAIVLAAGEDACTVYAGDEQLVVAYAAAFPRPRAERVSPGHLVAIAGVQPGAEVVVWRWFDAVVLGTTAGQVRVWEPGHGEVLALPRDQSFSSRPGSRAYVSAGLDGADWWVAGPAVDRAEDADVELTEVQRFVATHGVLENL